MGNDSPNQTTPGRSRPSLQLGQCGRTSLLSSGMGTFSSEISSSDPPGCSVHCSFPDSSAECSDLDACSPVLSVVESSGSALRGIARAGTIGSVKSFSRV